MNLFLIKQLNLSTNGPRVIDNFIVLARDLFYSVIIEKNIPTNEMPPVHFPALLLDYDETFKRFIEVVKNDIIKYGLRELGDACDSCNVPSYDQFNSATLDDP